MVRVARRFQAAGSREFHAQGIWHLLWGDLDDGITKLRQANLDNPSTSLATDLATGFLLRNAEKGTVIDLILALGTLDEAIQHQVPPAALFNRALALEKLHLYEEATLAWDNYLRTVPEPGWENEARAHFERNQIASRHYREDEIEAALLEESLTIEALTQLVATSPSLSRRLVLVTLLGGVERSNWSMTRAAAIAEAVKIVTSDPSLPIEIAHAREESNNSAALYSLYASARRHYDGREIDLAYQALNKAESRRRKPRRPIEFWVTYYQAICQYWFGNLERSRSILESLSVEVPGDWLDLRGHVDWMLGLIAANHGSPIIAADHYRRAFAAFEQGSFRQETAFLRVLMAEVLLDLGDTEGALAQLLPALADAGSILRPNLARGLYGQAAEAARRVGCPRVGLYFQDRTVRAAEEAGDPLVIAEGHYLLALSRLELGDPAGARSDLDAARRWMNEIDDPFAQRMVLAGVSLAESRLPEQPQVERLEKLNAAIENTEDQGASAALPSLLRVRALHKLQLGEIADGASDLRKAAQLILNQAISRPGELATKWKRQQIRDIFDSLVEVLVSEGRDDEALAFALVGRSLELGKVFGSLDQAADESLRLWSEIEPSSALVASRFVGDRLIVWLAKPGGNERFSLPFSLADASTLFATLLQNRNRPEADLILSRVAHKLEPLMVALQETGARRLAWIPDVPFLGFPIAALPDPQTSQPLIRKQSLITVQHLSTRPQRPEASESFLGVGNPDLANDSSLPALPSARLEVETIGRLFPNPTLLIGAAATKKAIMQHAPHSKTLHFAAHVISGNDGPHGSRLLLAGTDVLWGKEIQALDLSAAHLVVLSACHNSTQPGLHSLAQSFLGAGAASVIGSSWEVTDSGTEPIFAAFYGHLAAGTPPAEALRQAQLSAIEAGRPWSEWAAFQIISDWN